MPGKAAKVTITERQQDILRSFSRSTTATHVDRRAGRQQIPDPHLRLERSVVRRRPRHPGGAVRDQSPLREELPRADDDRHLPTALGARHFEHGTHDRFPL